MSALVRSRGPCLWLGRGAGQRARLDAVGSMAWHVGPTGAQGSGGLLWAMYSTAEEMLEKGKEQSRPFRRLALLAEENRTRDLRKGSGSWERWTSSHPCGYGQ